MFYDKGSENLKKKIATKDKLLFDILICSTWPTNVTKIIQ